MNPYTLLLKNAAIEMREFSLTSPEAKYFDSKRLERLASRTEAAGAIEIESMAEQEIKSIAHILLDGGPMSADFSSAFYLALNALQSKRKRENR